MARTNVWAIAFCFKQTKKHLYTRIRVRREERTSTHKATAHQKKRKEEKNESKTTPCMCNVCVCALFHCVSIDSYLNSLHDHSWVSWCHYRFTAFYHTINLFCHLVLLMVLSLMYSVLLCSQQIGIRIRTILLSGLCLIEISHQFLFFFLLKFLISKLNATRNHSNGIVSFNFHFV